MGGITNWQATSSRRWIRKPTAEVRASPALSYRSAVGPMGGGAPLEGPRAPASGEDPVLGRDGGEGVVLLGGVNPGLELDHAQLGELGPEPAVSGVQEAELLAVGNDLGEQQGLELPTLGGLLHHRDDRLRIHT